MKRWITPWSVGAFLLVVGLIIGFRDATDRNFGRPRVLRDTAQTADDGIRTELLLLRQQSWPAFWRPAIRYGYRYLQGEEYGIIFWAVKEGVLIQGGGDKPIIQRIECTSTGYRLGTEDFLHELDCTCRGGGACTVEDLEYLVQIRTDMGVTRSHPHVPLFTRSMQPMPH